MQVHPLGVYRDPDHGTVTRLDEIDLSGNAIRILARRSVRECSRRPRCARPEVNGALDYPPSANKPVPSRWYGEGRDRRIRNQTSR